tara:strand:+ start:68 stop:403 length:336 start_codon:yes stop_codon:yes gene_type:complete
MIEHLLVYGTLAPGESNHYMMKDIPGVWKTAYFKGIVLKKDWGKWTGYPGIILDNEADEIKGYVFSSRELKEHWDRLDEFEGKDYSRVKTSAKLEDGTLIEAHIYELKGHK